MRSNHVGFSYRFFFRLIHGGSATQQTVHFFMILSLCSGAWIPAKSQPCLASASAPSERVRCFFSEPRHGASLDTLGLGSVGIRRQGSELGSSGSVFRSVQVGNWILSPDDLGCRADGSRLQAAWWCLPPPRQNLRMPKQPSVCRPRNPKFLRPAFKLLTLHKNLTLNSHDKTSLPPTD